MRLPEKDPAQNRNASVTGDSERIGGTVATLLQTGGRRQKRQSDRSVEGL